jgi:hypothetical protein
VAVEGDSTRERVVEALKEGDDRRSAIQ